MSRGFYTVILKHLHQLSGVITMSVPVVYRSVEEILDVLNDEQHKNLEHVQKLLSIYKDHFTEYKKNSRYPQHSNNKFIILEGLDGSGKSTMAKILVEKGFGVRWCSPPHDLWNLRSDFDSNTTLKTAFYSLGNYIAAMQVAKILRKRSVVMDRYWHSTAAFAMGRAIKNNPERYSLPPEGDSYYHWPDDLLKPDKVFLLYVSEEERLKRLLRRTNATDEEKQLKADAEFRQTIIQAYRNMFDPHVDVIDSNGTKEECVQKILERLNK